MNCEQCKEEVLALIEREAIDPTGVREILDRCPDCRALFDEMKAALLAVEPLPLEDPPSLVDASVLRAAAMRGAHVTSRGKSRLQAPPWAMAAIAVLAVGIGVWSIPRDVELAGEDAFAPTAAESKEDFVAQAERSTDPQLNEQAVVAKSEAKELVVEEEVAARAERPSKPSATPVRREGAKAKRRTTTVPPRPADTAEAPPEESFGASKSRAGLETVNAPATDSRAAGAASPAALAADASDEKAQEDRDDDSDACRASIARFESRRAKDKAYAPDPEQELSLGRCYAKVGNKKAARTWLERAASHPKTKKRAQTALKKLTPN